jgi:RND family efflux transporter MFP subunit
VLPALVIVGFALVAAWAARDSLLPAQDVTVVPVVLAHAEVRQAGTPLFQAAGWVEPRPTPVMATALEEGVVKELLVVEGQEVKKGEPVARLVDTDARLAVAQAESDLALAEAELNVAKATLIAANRSLQYPVHLEAPVAEAEAELAKITTARKNLPFLVTAAEARLQLARQSLEGKRSAGAAIPGRSLQAAEREFEEAQAALHELKQRGPSLKSEAEAWQRKCDALRRQLELKNEEHRRVDEAKAAVKAAEARVERTKLTVEAAKLRLERMVVRSPINGRVLALNAQPGRRLVGMVAATSQDASTVVSLYDPKKLQVRADVRLEDVPHLMPGQPAHIQTAASKEVLTGEVIAITSQADIQKNTLQVKVAIHDPPPVIKPEMLVQVTFLSPQLPGDESEKPSDPLRLLVPKELVNQGQSGTSVWVADQQHNGARERSVQLGRAETEQLVEVASGLTALDKLIAQGRESLADGDRIRIVGMDANVGRASGSMAQNLTAPPHNRR